MFQSSITPASYKRAANTQLYLEFEHPDERNWGFKDKHKTYRELRIQTKNIYTIM